MWPESFTNTDGLHITLANTDTALHNGTNSLSVTIQLTENGSNITLADQAVSQLFHSHSETAISTAL